MKRSALPVLFCLTFAASNAFAQTTEAKKVAGAESTKAKSEKDPEAERIIRERRENAQSLLISLAADAGNYTDQRLRARTWARIADVLWEMDPERARTLFRKAWDAAEFVDQESGRITLEEIKQQEAKRGNVAVANRLSIRNEVLRLAARRDHNLGEEFLSKLSAARSREAEELADKTRSNKWDAPEAVSQRLNLARQLIDTDVRRALQFADPVLTSVTREAVDFLSYLREKDAIAADQRYAALMSRAVADLQSDANTVSLLSSYIFTPHLFVQFSPDGGANTQSSRNPTPQDISADLRSAFLRAAGDILLRPLAPPGQDQTTAGIQGKYLMLKRLGPLFDQFAPRELAEAVRAQTDALAQAVSEDVRQRDDSSLREGIRPPQNSEDREKTLLDRIEHAKTAEERDRLYVLLSRLYSESGDMRAREVLQKIDDTDLQKQAYAYIDASMTMNAVDKKNVDRVLELVRIGELTHFQKAWALSRAANLLAKTDREKSLSLIDDATAEARRIEISDPDRPRALLAIANVILTADRAKIWDFAYEVAKAANSAEGFTGEDGVIRISLITKAMSSIRSNSSGEFDVSGVFTELARDDYGRTVELVRLFERQAPRASATIAIARAVFEEKKKP